jgi:hypothetical protein
MVLPFAPILVGMYVLVATSGGVPRIDIESNCQATEKTIQDIFGDSTGITVGNCMRQENAAREDMLKDWASYTAADKAHCAQPKGYNPSYVEWLTCFEMQRDVRQLRLENPVPGAQPRPRR